MKKNPFAGARDTIRKSELDISENTVKQRLDDTGLYSYYAANKTIYIGKEPKSSFGVRKGSQKLDGRTVETNFMGGRDEV